MLTFRQFLLEGGHATAKYETQRAKQADVDAVLKFVAKTLHMSYDVLKKDLLGSTELTLLGKKEDSGDVDIAFSLKNNDVQEINRKMLDAVNGEGEYNAGTKVGSYAVPVNGKKIQTDLMFVNNKDWARFMYHSALGRGSKYPGSVRNILLFTALTKALKDGEDFVLKTDEGQTFARASKSVTMDAGMKRLFKMSKLNSKTGKYNKALDKVSPDELEAHLKSIGKDIKFSKSEDFTDNPDEIAAHIFGPNVKGSDLMTAENVIKHSKKLKNAEEVIAACKSELERLKMPIPSEL